MEHHKLILLLSGVFAAKSKAKEFMQSVFGECEDVSGDKIYD